MDNGNKSSNIESFYPKLSNHNILLLNKKGYTLKRKIAGFNHTNKEEELQIIEDILTIMNDSTIYLNQGIEINSLLNNISNDNELNLNTHQKISILKDNISNIVNEKLGDYENNIIKKAYNEYSSVNYVIVTTLIIDDIIDEINELNKDFEKNKYSKIEYEQKINTIKEKIKNLEIINNRKEVQDEIENLRKDFYTKKKDKYDLLYNDEIFTNLNSRCDELLNLVSEKDKQEKIIVKKQDEERELLKLATQKKKEEQKEKNKLKEEKEKQEQEFNENILKRFIDMEFANKLLKIRESMRKKLNTKDEIISETMNYYNEFLQGEMHQFNFERNRIKMEVAKLYNDITSTICIMEQKEFIPLEHINIKLEVLTRQTLEHQDVLNYMIEKKHQHKMEENETSRAVTTKLTNILENEKVKETNKKDEKVLKKEYIPIKKEDHDERKN